MDQKVRTRVRKKRSSLSMYTSLTIVQHAEFLMLCEKLHMDKASAVRYSVLEKSQKIVTNVKGILDTLDRLGPAIASSGDAIASAVNGGHQPKQNNLLTQVQKMEGLIHQHIFLQRQLEAHMRKLINLMANS